MWWVALRGGLFRIGLTAEIPILLLEKTELPTILSGFFISGPNQVVKTGSNAPDRLKGYEGFLTQHGKTPEHRARG